MTIGWTRKVAIDGTMNPSNKHLTDAELDRLIKRNSERSIEDRLTIQDLATCAGSSQPRIRQRMAELGILIVKKPNSFTAHNRKRARSAPVEWEVPEGIE